MKQYSPFRFKQFMVEHNRAAMKVGTDGVLLGAWSSINENEHVLDVGTGTGLLSLMLAQKVNGKCQIDALEIDKGALQDATINIRNCPWSKSIRLLETDFNSYDSQKQFDLIVCNPPFYEGKFSTNAARNIARNAKETLSFNTLLEKSVRILKPEGRLFLIVPFEITDKIISTARQLKLPCKKRANVRPRLGLSFKRSLLEFRKTENEMVLTVNELCLQEANSNMHTYEFKKLTEGFYL